MCSTLKLLNTVSLQNNINANCALSNTSDHHYSIITEDGIYILHLCGLMDTISSSISFKKAFISIPDYFPSANLGIDLNQFLSELPRDEFYEAILNLDISEKVRDATHIKQQPIQAKWSPLGLVSNCHCAIASLTDRGSLDIFVHTVNEVELEEYVSIVNITKCYIIHLKSSWSKVTGNASRQLSVIKSRLHEALPTAFEWSHLITINDRQFCFLFVAHLNGDISTWRIYQRNLNQVDDSGIQLISTYKTNLKRITALSWQQVNNNGLLLAGDLEGKVKLMCVRNITEQSLSFCNDLYLWNELDNIRVDCIKILRQNGMTYILIVKRSILLICLINKSGDILDIHNFHAGNLYISGIEHLEGNIVLVLSHTGVIKEIKLIVVNNKLQIDWRYIYVDFPWNLYQTHGLLVSPNKVFIAVLVSMAKINDIRRKKGHIKLLIFKNMNQDPLSALMNNSSESLTTYWDCLEILRLNGVIEKKLPCDGLPSGLNYDKLSAIQLKTCLWLAKSSETLYDKMYLLEEYTLLRSDELKYMLKIKLACKHMHHLFQKINNGEKLNEFHMQSLDIINMYLKEVVVDDVIPSLGLGKNTIAELYDAISAANELQYPAAPQCVICKEDIIGTSCVPSHIDTRCCISFMQVVDLPYYKCLFCTSIVHWKVTDVYINIICPFCDIAMDLVSVRGATTANSEELQISSCFSSCITESIDINDIEDHALVTVLKDGEHVDLLAVSESEEDEEENICEDTTSENLSVVEATTHETVFVKNIKNE